MKFHNAYITQKGKELFDRIISGPLVEDHPNETTSKKIVWGKAETSNWDLSSHVASDAGFIINLEDIVPPSGDPNYNANLKVTSSGYVKNAENKVVPKEVDGIIQDLHAVTVTSEMHNGGNNWFGPAYTFGVWAKLEGDEAQFNSMRLVLIGVWNGEQGTTPDSIPNVNSESWSGIVDFYIVLDKESLNDINAPAGWYANVKDFINLRDRTVTSHKLGSETTGDNQAVYGEKTFKSKLTCDAALVTKNITTTGNVSVTGNISATGTIVGSSTITATGDITSSGIVSGTKLLGTLGDSSNRQKLWASGIYFNASETAAPYIVSVSDKLKVAGTVYPNSDITYNLGTPNNKWGTVYASTFEGSLIGSAICLEAPMLVEPSTASLAKLLFSSSPVKSWKTNVSLTPLSDYGADLGFYSSTSGSSRRWNYIYGKYLGSSSSYFSDAYISTIHGNASSASQVGITGVSNSANYPLVFTSSVGTSAAANKNLYTDTANSLYYNPSSNILSCTTFSGNLSGNATSATKATQDSDGNTITSYYCTLSTSQTITGSKTFNIGNNTYGTPIFFKSTGRTEDYAYIAYNSDSSYTDIIFGNKRKVNSSFYDVALNFEVSGPVAYFYPYNVTGSSVYCLGKEDHYWDFLYTRHLNAGSINADSIYGPLPNPTSNVSTPLIGQIFLGLVLLASGHYQDSISTGATLSAQSLPSGYLGICYAALKYGSNSRLYAIRDSNSNITTGTYRVLSGGHAGGEQHLICLMMRIS